MFCVDFLIRNSSKAVNLSCTSPFKEQHVIIIVIGRLISHLTGPLIEYVNDSADFYAPFRIFNLCVHWHLCHLINDLINVLLPWKTALSQHTWAWWLDLWINGAFTRCHVADLTLFYCVQMCRYNINITQKVIFDYFYNEIYCQLILKTWRLDKKKVEKLILDGMLFMRSTCLSL